MGIYVHIPFCRSKCFYCGFYSVASTYLQDEYINALIKEMEIRKDYLPERKVSTLYFGGGTPTYLENRKLEMIVHKIHDIWNLDEDAECSIEMNPEDATVEKLLALRALGFNRLTIGVQSFQDAILKRINRTHTVKQALQAIENAYHCNFDNVGIDLIIGLPGSHASELEKDFRIVNKLFISHISVYILSIDSNSVFERLSEKGKFISQEDDLLAEQYLMISEYLKSIGYEHYEISNFAKDFKYSRHNTSYWRQSPYIGLGASAHSYDLNSRQWNVSHLKTYINSLNNNKLNIEKEVLTVKDKYNEYLMTNFRTMWGVDCKKLEKIYPAFWEKAQKKLNLYCEEGLMIRFADRIRMSERGWLISDGIFSELFV